jgi:hypothetical protein
MTYEEYLDEVTTLLTELYKLSDAAAIKHVMRAQAEDFFTLHDDDPAMRTQERAELDAKTIFAQKNKSRPEAFHKVASKPVSKPASNPASDAAPKPAFKIAPKRSK